MSGAKVGIQNGTRKALGEFARHASIYPSEPKCTFIKLNVLSMFGALVGIQNGTKKALDEFAK
jgi:hypothetical protein